MTTRKAQEQNLIELRRSKIAELLAQGYTSHVEISQLIHCSRPTVSRDISHINRTVIENLKDHIDKQLPRRYMECDIGLKSILKKSWEIVNDPDSKKSEVIQALSLISSIYDKLMDLSTNGGIVDRGISIINKRKAELIALEQKLYLERSESDIENEEEKRRADLDSERLF